MEISQASLRIEGKRQARRKKILENSKSRMDKLKNLQRSPTLVEEYSKSEEIQQAPTIFKDDDADTLDPPDELIPRPPEVKYDEGLLGPSVVETSSESALSYGLKAISTDGIWKIRSILALLCAFFAVVQEEYIGLSYSCVMLVSVVDCGWLLCVVLLRQPSASGAPPVNPLGKLSLLKLPLMFVHPSLAKWFDPVFHILLFIGFLIRDILIMLFVRIAIKCIVMCM